MYFFDIILKYSARSITKEEDTIFAVVGALQPVALKLGGGLVQGLPTGAWDIAISMQNFPQNPRYAWKPWVRKPNFPSWSWAGWNGMPNWKWSRFSSFDSLAPAENFLQDQTWIVWFKYQHGRTLLLAEASETSTRGAHVFKGGPLSPTARAKKQFPKLKTSRVTPSNCYLTKPYPLLLFFSVSVHLKLTPWRSRYGNSDARKREAQRLFGFNLGLDELILRDHKGRACGKLGLDTDDHKYDNVVVELVVLSEASDWGFNHPFLRLAEDMSSPMDLESIADQNWRKRIRGRITDAPEWMVCEAYWVMLVEWKENVYERRGHGAIVKAAVDSSFPPGPQWKEIILG